MAKKKKGRSEEPITLFEILWKILRSVLIVICAFVIVCGGIYTAYQKVNEVFFSAVDPDNKEPVTFVVKSGTSLSTVARSLEEAGLIRNSTVFKYMADFQGMGQLIQSGHYELNTAMSSGEILSQLISGDGLPTTARITIIPGWTVEDVAEYLRENRIIDNEDEFLSLCKNGRAFEGYDFIASILNARSSSSRRYILEGYLSPNTYEIYTSADDESIIRKLLSQTSSAYLSSYDERAEELGMTMDNILTLASMIEKEAKTRDFARVSAVFHNRLKADMALGSDATLKYASGSQKMVLSDSDLAVDGPYNTYKNKGLPAGPICNPSMDAVQAALYPDESFIVLKYLYFCSTDPDSGDLHFSRTLEEHNAAVAMYRPLWEEYDRKRGLSDDQ